MDMYFIGEGYEGKIREGVIEVKETPKCYIVTNSWGLALYTNRIFKTGVNKVEARRLYCTGTREDAIKLWNAHISNQITVEISGHERRMEQLKSSILGSNKFTAEAGDVAGEA